MESVYQSTLVSQADNAKGKRKETTTQRKRRLEKEKRKRQEKLATETEEDKRIRLDKRNQRLRHESQEQRETRLLADRQRHARQRRAITNETQEQRELRLQDLLLKVANETQEQCEAHEERQRIQHSHVVRRVNAQIATFERTISAFCDTTCEICMKRCYPNQVEKCYLAETKVYLPDELRNKQVLQICHCCKNHINCNMDHSPPKAYWNKGSELGQLSQDVTSIYPMPIIKTEIPDPSELHQEFILPDSIQHATATDPMLVVKTEIQDSPITNQFILPNIKVEPIDVDDALDLSSRTEDLSEGFINSEIENSLTFKYKLTKCSVLLDDCLIPENLASISAKFKSLKINTDIPKTYPKHNLFPLSDTPFLPHISEAYKKLSFPLREKRSYSYQKKKLKPNDDVRLSNLKKRRSCDERAKKHVCSCFKASEDAMISMGSGYYENFSESTQQLCSCLTSDYMLTESTDILMKEVALFDPDFGKITGSVNKTHFSF